MTANTDLSVTTHIGRDLLASAASFKTEAAVVWEYVVNSLQYVDPGVCPRVNVQIGPSGRDIFVADNGSGMTAEGLIHFFRMHGENRERMAGRAGRGKFGTGKSAAFGIASTLEVDTIRNGRRNLVRLTRSMIEESGGEEIPLNWDAKNQAVDEPNGTTVFICDIEIPKIKRSAIIDYVERHLQAFRASSPEVAIDNHVCAYRQPDIEEELTFDPSDSQRAVLGDVRLTVWIARAPLPLEEQGVAVTAGLGNLVAIERAGLEAKESGNYLLGEIDVPALEAHDSPIEPFDPTRSLQLNPQHPVVAVLLGYIGSKLEDVRLRLVRKSKDARKTENARRLAMEAEKIAEILNEDFRKISERLHEIRAASSRKGPAGARFGTQKVGDEDETWVRGTREPGTIAAVQERGTKGGGQKDRKPPNVEPSGDPLEEGENLVDPVGGAGSRRRPRGGFRVEYRNLGKNEDRSLYDPTTLTILINLDHKLVATALGASNVEDPTFRRLSYEIAFSEYSMGLGYEISKQDPNIPADDLLFEVRSTLNRISFAAVALYR